MGCGHWPRICLLLLVVLVLAGCDRAPDRLAREAQAALARGDTDVARGRLALIVETYPDHPRAAEARYWRAEIARTIDKDTRRAQIDYQGLIRRFPASPFALRARWRLAELYEKTFDRPRRAAVVYTEVAQAATSPGERSRARRAAGRSYETARDYDQALIEYETSLAEGPEAGEAAEALWRKASVLDLMGRCREARVVYGHLIADHPESSWRLDAELSRASCLEEEEKLKEALVVYQALSKRYPDNAAIPTRMAAVKKRLGKREK